MLKTAFPIALRVLPLTGALFLMAADGDACIVIDVSNDGDGDGDGDGEDCLALDELCPNLVCDAGNVVVDGCAICECEPVQVCDLAFPPECDNAFITDDCQWRCGDDVCTSDDDCGGRFFCDFSVTSQEPGAPDDGAADRFAAGVCRPLIPGCSSDAECGPGFLCLHDQAGGGASPPSPDGDQAMPPPPDGVCVAVAVECFTNEDCARGQRCEQPTADTDPNAGLVAPGGICVDDGAACTSDLDCDGGACFDGLCVDQGCFADDECGAGQDCVGTDICACTTECQDDGQGGCIPCDCASLPGICVDVLPAGDGCYSDLDCAEGTRCNAGVDVCELPPECTANEPCLAVCYGSCIATGQ